MGAWGHGSFENDDAADWLAEFEAVGFGAVAAALERVTRLADDEYLEAPEASMAIAAAEMVAAARAGDMAILPKNAQAAFVRHRSSLMSSPIRDLAHSAVQRVRRKSELKDLWDEAGQGDAWMKAMESLIQRLR